MKIISFIEQEDLIRKIIKHLGLWKVKFRPPHKIHSPPAELYADYSDSQIPPWDDDCSDPDYPVRKSTLHSQLLEKIKNLD